MHDVFKLQYQAPSISILLAPHSRIQLSFSAASLSTFSVCVCFCMCIIHYMLYGATLHHAKILLRPALVLALMRMTIKPFSEIRYLTVVSWLAALHHAVSMHV